MVKKTLDDLLAEEDELGLLNVKPLASNTVSDTARVAQQFEEVNRFVDHHKLEPGEKPEGRKVGVTERTLALRLKTYRESPELADQLRPMDRHGLLKAVEAPAPLPKSLDEILELDDELLTTPNENIFEMRHARPAAMTRPDKVSERKTCEDFERFKPLFDQCATDLESSVRKSMPFANEQEIRAGDFFILNGITVFVSEVRDPHIRGGKKNARLRLIFENGTEGENLLRSLATELYKDPNGRRISDPTSGPLFYATEQNKYVSAPAEHISGFIYVVRSLSAGLFATTHG